MLYYKFVEEGHNAFYDNQKAQVYNIEGHVTDSFPDMSPVDTSKSLYFVAEAKKLRINRVLPEFMNPLISDFTILGFKKTAPHYDRGRKVKAEYWGAAKDEIIVKKLFEDVRDENGRLTGLKVIFQWFCEDGSIGLTKTELVKNYNKSEARTEERKRRERQIDYLEAEAEGTDVEPYVEMIINKYQPQIMKYVQHGIANDWNSSMLAETDPTLQYVLNQIYQARRDDPTKTINTLQSIQYHIGVKTLEEIEQENGESDDA